MAKKRGRPPKTPFSDLPDEFKDKIAQGDEALVRAEASAVAMAESENLATKALDMDLVACRATYTAAGAQYAEATKMNKLKLKFIHQTLQGRGRI